MSEAIVRCFWCQGAVGSKKKGGGKVHYFCRKQGRDKQCTWSLTVDYAKEAARSIADNEDLLGDYQGPLEVGSIVPKKD